MNPIYLFICNLHVNYIAFNTGWPNIVYGLPERGMQPEFDKVINYDYHNQSERNEQMKQRHLQHERHERDMLIKAIAEEKNRSSEKERRERDEKQKKKDQAELDRLNQWWQPIRF